MRRDRIVVDTNVVVSGLLFGGLPRKIVRAGLRGAFEWVTSEPLLEELARVVGSRKFGLSRLEIDTLL